MYLNVFLLASAGEAEMQDIWSLKKINSMDIVAVLYTRVKTFSLKPGALNMFQNKIGKS